MTATNHALTGAAIGIFVGNPLIAFPAAVASHFVCDAIPHYGAADKIEVLRTRRFKLYLILEAVLCFLIVLALATFQPENWQVAAVCAFLAAAPDLYWIGKYRAAIRHKKYKETWFGKFAGDIQWFQRPIGAVVEIAWFVALLSLILPVFKLLVKS